MPLFRAYRRRDPVARRIVEQATDQLAEQHHHACEVARREAGAKKFSPVVLFGGVLRGHRDFATILKRKIARNHKTKLEFKEAHDADVMRPACGALLFALGRSETAKLRLPSGDIIKRVMQTQAQPQFAEALSND